MRTFEKVKGAPVFFEENNMFVGKVSDIVLSEEVVKGFWIQTSRWWSTKRFLPLEKVSTEDGSGIYIKMGTTLQQIPKKLKRFTDGKNHFLGKPLKEADGTTIGIIEDVYFLPDSGKIVGYELTEGLFSDLTKGIKVIKPKSPTVCRETSFIVLEES